MSLTLVIALSLLGVSILGLGIALWMLLNPSRTASDRIQELTGTTHLTLEEPLLHRPAQNKLTGRIARLAQSDDPEQLSLQRQQLLQAGFRSPNALQYYLASRVILALSLPFVLFFLLPRLPAAALALVVFTGAATGYYLPSFFIDFATARRRRAMLRVLPDVLDLLVSSTEAGLGLDAAFDRVARELEEAAPDLSLELQVVTHEVTAGVPRADSLRRLSQRTGLPALNSLVNVLVQADRLGTSVAQALRVHASTVRTRRLFATEEAAAKISPKMTVAMIIFLLPPLFVVIMGPAVVGIIRQLLPTMALG